MDADLEYPLVSVPDNDGYVITENLETQELFVQSPKRQETLIIYKRSDRTPFFTIRYESGKPVAKSIQGEYTARKKALTAVKNYLANSKKSHHKKQMELFGPEPPEEERPVLKRKKRVRSNGKDSSTADS